MRHLQTPKSIHYLEKAHNLFSKDFECDMLTYLHPHIAWS